MSRMWGTLLDQVVEVEVVTADGKIQRASESENSDLFWALRGAGASFGVITEFVIKTHPQPAAVAQYSYSFSLGSQSEMAPIFKKWQDVVYDPDMDDRFSTLFIAEPFGVVITGTFYGTESEYHASGIPAKLPTGGDISSNVTDWLGGLAHDAEVEGLYVSNIPNEFYSKSLGLRVEDKLDDDAIDDLFSYLDSANKGTLAWFVIWDTEGGAINKISADAASYPHRDKIIFYQSYAVGVPILEKSTISFVEKLDQKVRAALPGANTTYAGYVDPRVSHDEAVAMYWGDHLPELEQIKAKWDPKDVFHNPQSVTPASKPSKKRILQMSPGVIWEVSD